MIDKASAIETVLERIAKLPVGEALDMRTYKRNRSVLMIRTAPGELRIVQNGFEKADFTTPDTKLRKVLKTLLRKEFPRSTKIRLYTLGSFDESMVEISRKKI